MVGVIILTHGLFGEELFRAAEMIVGKQDNVEIIAMQAGCSIKDIAEHLGDVISGLGNEGVVVFTDMFGGSPSNISMAYLQDDAVEVVSGVNLPMLLKAFTMRMDSKHTLADIASESAEAARASIKVAGNLLNKIAK